MLRVAHVVVTRYCQAKCFFKGYGVTDKKLYLGQRQFLTYNMMMEKCATFIKCLIFNINLGFMFFLDHFHEFLIKLLNTYILLFSLHFFCVNILEKRNVGELSLKICTQKQMSCQRCPFRSKQVCLMLR